MDVALPFGLKAGDIFITAVLFWIGYIVGSSVKAGVKYALILIGVLILACGLGFIPNTTLANIVTAVKTASPLLGDLIGGNQASFTLSGGALTVGFVIGLIRG